MAKRKTTTKAKRGAPVKRATEPLPDAWDHSDEPTAGPIHFVPALSGSEVLFFRDPDPDLPATDANAKPVLCCAPIIAWAVAALGEDFERRHLCAPVAVEDYGKFYVIKHGNGHVADPFSGAMFDNETQWLEQRQLQRNQTPPQQE